MNVTEAGRLCRLVSCLCPGQRFDEYSPEAWSLALSRVSYDDAKQACADLAGLDLEPGKSRYIEPGHVAAQVKRIRAKRLDDYGPVDPPAGLEPSEYLGWLRSTNEAIASGRAPERKQLPTNAAGVRRLEALTDGIGRDVDGAA